MEWFAATAIRMTKRYSHIGSQALREAVDVLGGVNPPAEFLKNFSKSREDKKVAVQ